MMPVRPLTVRTAPIVAWLQCALGEEVDVHVSAEAAADVREQEIDPVKSNEPHEGDRLTKNVRTAVSADEQ